MGLRLTKQALNALIDAPSLDTALMIEDRQQVILLGNERSPRSGRSLSREAPSDLSRSIVPGRKVGPNRLSKNQACDTGRMPRMPRALRRSASARETTRSRDRSWAAILSISRITALVWLREPAGRLVSASAAARARARKSEAGTTALAKPQAKRRRRHRAVPQRKHRIGADVPDFAGNSQLDAASGTWPD